MRARGRSAGSCRSSPVTSGASTRSASSSSSCPVSSPSRTTIVFPAIDAPPWIRTARPRLHRKLYGPERRMEAARLARTIPLRGRAREADHRRGRARADRVAGDSPGLARRLDLAARRREAPGDRHRQGRTAPVPLPPRIPRAPGAGEVRQADQLRGEAAGPARGDGRAHGAGAAQLRMDGGGGGAADQPRLVPCRRRALCEEVPDLRDHDAAQEPRARSRKPGRVSLPRQASRARAHGARRLRARGRDEGAAGGARRAERSFATATTTSSSTSARAA